jgi:adenosylcobinamide-GDP ribazoletransferase
MSRTPAPELRAAIAFLTRVPAGGDAELARAAPLFPLVGAALGGIVGGTAALLEPALPPLAAAAIAVAVELALTGALHADGLADSADGLAGRTPEHALAIMRDHALGAYGACALVLDLLLKTVALAHAPVPAVVAAFAVSRAAPLPLAAALPYARPGAGTGRLLERMSPVRALAGVALAAAAAVALQAPAALAVLALVTATVGLLARRRLGGVTGDVMGAAIELTATISLLAA